jgi:transcriptional regulator with XRE-family HTH domain
MKQPNSSEGDPGMSLLRLGHLVRKKRGDEGIRSVAALIQVSAATLSRVERGHVPDIETFRKICTWLEVDPNEFLGVEAAAKPPAALSAAALAPPAVHFRADNTFTPDAASDFAQLVLAAQAEVIRRGI